MKTLSGTITNIFKRAALMACTVISATMAIKAQNVGIGATSFTPSAKSMLEIRATDKGLLIPRMTDVQRVAIAPTSGSDFGLMVYQTNTISSSNAAGFWYWDGTMWIRSNSSIGWGLTGNAGTSATTNFIGTTDSVDFIMKTNSTERSRIKANGNFGIGTASPSQKLQVEASGSAGPIVRIHSSTDNPASLSLTTTYKTYRLGQNRPPDSPSTTDGFFIYDETANATRQYITSSGNVGIGTCAPTQKLSVSTGMNVDNNNANNGNLTNALIFGNGSGEGIASKRTASGNQFGMDFYTSSINRMAITNAGNVGIGTTSPTSKLQVNSSGDGILVNSMSTGIIVNNAGVYPGGWNLLNYGYAGWTAFAGYNGIMAAGIGHGIEADAWDDNNAATDHSGGMFTVQNNAINNLVAGSNVAARLGGTTFKIVGLGTVSTIVADLQNKPRAMSCPETPEVLLQDFGSAQLVNGKVHINLDPVFSKNIKVDAKHSMKVFIQLEGNCNGVYVSNKEASGFDVTELNNGISNVTFSWFVSANRANEILGGTESDYESFRFKPVTNAMYQTVFESAVGR